MSRGRSRERSPDLHYSGRSREENRSRERGQDRSTDRRRRERMDWQDCRDERGQRLEHTSSKERPSDPYEEQSMFRYLNHFWILTFAAFKMSNRHTDYWVKINDDTYFILRTQIINKCKICWSNVFLHSLFRPVFHVFYIFRGPDGRNLDMKIAASTKIMIREILFS